MKVESHSNREHHKRLKKEARSIRAFLLLASSYPLRITFQDIFLKL